MKKTILTLLAIACFAGTAFATYVDVQDGVAIPASGTAQMNVKGSKNVKIEYVADTTTAGQGYVLGASHGSGTQTFGTSSGDTKVYKHDGTFISVPTTAPKSDRSHVVL